MVALIAGTAVAGSASASGALERARQVIRIAYPMLAVPDSRATLQLSTAQSWDGAIGAMHILLYGRKDRVPRETADVAITYGTNAAGRLAGFVATGPYVGTDRLLKVRNDIDRDETIDEAGAARVLDARGAEFGPLRLSAFEAATRLGVPEYQAVFGDFQITETAFSFWNGGEGRDREARLIWHVRTRGRLVADGVHFFSFEPFEGKLISILREK